MGPNHVLSGLCVGVATLPLAGRHDVGYQALWVLAWGGAALLPDLDQEGSLAPTMWGPISQVPSSLIGALAGGHRWGTHDVVLAPIAVGGFFWVARLVPQLHLLALALMVGLVVRGLVAIEWWRAGALANLILSWGGAWWLTGHGGLAIYDSWWLIAAGGVVVHILGDAITRTGVPIPIVWIGNRGARAGVPLLTTGQGIECTLLPVAWTLLLLALLSRHSGIHTWDQLQAGAFHLLDQGAQNLARELSGVLQAVARHP